MGEIFLKEKTHELMCLVFLKNLNNVKRVSIHMYSESIALVKVTCKVHVNGSHCFSHCDEKMHSTQYSSYWLKTRIIIKSFSIFMFDSPSID